MSDKRGGV